MIARDALLAAFFVYACPRHGQGQTRDGGSLSMRLSFPRVDELPEKVLDILAAQSRGLQWYEINAPIWNKRQAVKECMLVHNKRQLVCG